MVKRSALYLKTLCENDFFYKNDKKIIEKAEKGFSLNSLFLERRNFEDNEDEIISLAHVLNLLKKIEIKYPKKEIIKIFEKYYRFKYHGVKEDYLNFILSLNSHETHKRGLLINDYYHNDKLYQNKKKEAQNRSQECPL